MTIDEALKQLREVKRFLDVCEYRGREEDMEAIDVVLAFVDGKADPRQTALPLAGVVHDASPVRG